MARVGITGHVDISEETARWITHALTTRLRAVMSPGWRGITCLARGADQIFAGAVLSLGGPLDVVLPADDYERCMTGDGDQERFRSLLARAADVRTMPYPTSGRVAFLAASDAMLSRCDLLLAVWDGTPPRQMGDTADVVRRAEARRIPVAVLWPPGEGSRPDPDTAASLAFIPAGAPDPC
jgi:hypothetical protein